MPLSVTAKQPRQRCAHSTAAPPSSTAPAPRVLPVLGTLSSAGITLGAPRGSSPAYAWTSPSIHTALASPVLPAPSPARAHPLQDGVLLPFREAGGQHGWYVVSIKGC